MFPDENSKSAQLFNRALAVMPGGNSRHTVFFQPAPGILPQGGALLGHGDIGKSSVGTH